MCTASSRASGSLASATASSASRPSCGDAGAARGAHELDRHVQEAFEPLGHEVVNVVRGVGGHLGALLDEQAVRERDEALDVDRERAREREPAEADRRPAQPVRVAGARSALAERERDGEVVDPLGDCQHSAGLRLRQRAAGGVGEVLLLDRPAHGLRIAGEAGVLGADVALELRELPNELGGLVGLGEARSLA